MAAALLQIQKLVQRLSRSRQSSLAAVRHPHTITCQPETAALKPADQLCSRSHQPPQKHPQTLPEQKPPSVWSLTCSPADTEALWQPPHQTFSRCLAQVTSSVHACLGFTGTEVAMATVLKAAAGGQRRRSGCD